MIDITNLNLIYDKQVEKVNMKKILYSFCNQLVINPSMATHVLYEDRFAKKYYAVREDCFWKLCGNYDNGEISKPKNYPRKLCKC